MKEMVGGCCVCSDERGWDENPLVYCDGHGCNVAVHQACYGIVQVPSGPWFCRKCESQERIARVKCELCPSREGALKRSDNGGWCHVICALFIPEVQFGSVDTMEPVIINNVKLDRFGKLCYICEEQGRGTRASSGACMQCNKSGCKMHFHVTCAQAMGMLCEETGHYNDNVKYCGYCASHYKKLQKDSKDSNIKTIPAFKPVGTAHSTPDSTPEKSSQSPRSPLKPLVGCKAREKMALQGKEFIKVHKEESSTTKEHKTEHSKSTKDTKEPKLKLKDSIQTKSPKEEKTKEPKEESKSSLSPLKSSELSSPSSIHMSPKFTTANFVETTLSPGSEELKERKEEEMKIRKKEEKEEKKNEKKEEKKKKLVRNDSFSSGSTESAVDIETVKPTQHQLTPLTVVIKKEAILENRKEESHSVKVKDGNLLPMPLVAMETAPAPTRPSSRSTAKSPGLLVTTAPSSVTAPSTSTLTAVLTSTSVATVASTSSAVPMETDSAKDMSTKGKMKSSVDEEKKSKFSATFENFLNNYNMENPTDPDLLNKDRPAKRQKSKSSDKRKSKKSKHGDHDVSRTKTEDKLKQSSEYDWPMSSPSASATPASTLPGTRLNICTEPNVQAAGSVSSESVINGFTSSGSCPVPPNQRHRQRVTQQAQAQPFPTSLEQLLERQWEQGSQFILEQAQHFDIASLLTCLHQLKSENSRLEDYINNLTARRDSLLAINARLTLPMAERNVRSPRSHGNDHGDRSTTATAAAVAAVASTVRSPTMTSQSAGMTSQQQAQAVNGDVPSMHHGAGPQPPTKARGRGRPRTPERRPSGSGGRKPATSGASTSLTATAPTMAHTQDPIQLQLAQHLQLLQQLPAPVSSASAAPTQLARAKDKK